MMVTIIPFFVSTCDVDIREVISAKGKKVAVVLSEAKDLFFMSSSRKRDDPCFQSYVI